MLPHAPVQHSLQDVPAIELNVDGGLDELSDVLRRKKLRECLICPAVYKGSPMTPLPNPTTGHRSYHVVRLVSTRKHGVIVELLFCDHNMYLIAYRQFVPGKRWSLLWKHFKDQSNLMPHFFQHGEYMEMSGITVTHKESITVKGGEYAALENIFYVLANPDSSIEDTEHALFSSVIILCEVTRLEIVKKDMIERFADYLADPRIDGLLWTFMKSWKKLSKCALDNRKRVKEKKLVRADPILMGHVANCKINHIDEVIGPKGQLKLILLNPNEFTPYIDVPYPDGFRDEFPELDQYDAIMASLVEDVIEEAVVQEGAVVEEDIAQEGGEG